MRSRFPKRRVSQRWPSCPSASRFLLGSAASENASPSDLSMKYLDGSKFTAQTLDGQGNPLTNQNVSFNINGVLYHKVTDKEGIASLNITLLAGEYIITSYWNDFQVGNTIKID